MGNTPSVEAPPPAFSTVAPTPAAALPNPQKLSKPRVGRHASYTAGLLSPPHGLSSNIPVRHSTAFLPDQLPYAAYETASTTTTASSVATGPSAATSTWDDGYYSQQPVYVVADGPIDLDVPPPPPRKDTPLRDKTLFDVRRTSLFRSKSSQEPNHGQGVGRSEWRSSVASFMTSKPSGRQSGRSSRANSMSSETAGSSFYAQPVVMAESWNAPGSHMSLNYDMSSYEAKRLLNLREDYDAPEPDHYESTSIMSETRFDVVSETTWKSSHPAGSAGPAGPASSTGTLHRTASDLSLYAPVRRRSIIQTPGVATRSTPTPVPTQSLSKKASFRHSTPNHSRRNSLDEGINFTPARVLSMPPRLSDPDSPERVVTPCENQYRQLGSMRFGSLRITNGAASPIPSPESERRTNKSRDGLTALEKTDSASGTVSSTNGKAASYFTGTNSDNGKSELSVGSDKTQKQKIDRKPVPTVTVEIKPIEVKQPKPLSRLLSPLTTTFLKATESATIRTNSLMSRVSKQQQPAIEPLPVNGEYLAEIQFSPFSFTDSRPTSAEGLQTTSKAAAVDDNLFDLDDGASSSGTSPEEYSASASEVLHVREDFHARKLERPKPDPSQRSVRTVTRSDSGLLVSPTSEYAHSHAPSHKPLSKADSGYSSNVSLRSFQSTKPPVPEKDLQQQQLQLMPAPEIVGLERSTSRASFLGDIRLPSPTLLRLEDVQLVHVAGQVRAEVALNPPAPKREAPPPPIPPKDASGGSALRSPVITTHPGTLAVQHVALLAAPARKRSKKVPAPIDSSRGSEFGAGQHSDIHSPGLDAQLSPASSDTSNSALSIGSGSHKPGKLQRLLSGAGIQRGPPSVHITHPTADRPVPSVPHDVEAKLHEHTGLFPITTKRLALRTEASKETLKTIFSVGSVEVLYPDEGRYGNLHENDTHAAPEDPKPRRRRSLQSVGGSIIQAAAHVIPTRKPVHRKPVPAQAEADKMGDKPHHDEHEQRHHHHLFGHHGHQTDKHAHAQLEDRDTDADNMDTDFEASVTSIDNIRHSIGNSAFDQAVFTAMIEERDMHYAPTPVSGRTSSINMTAQLERDVEMRLQHHKSLRVSTNGNGTPSPRLADPVSPNIPQPSPQMLPEVLMYQHQPPARTGPTPPPVSMRTRSVRNLRKPPPLRSQSDSMGRSNSLRSETSRESLRSYHQGSVASPTTSLSVTSPIRAEESTSPPAIPPMNPRRSSISRDAYQQQPQQLPAQRSAPPPFQTDAHDYEAWRSSSRPPSVHSRRGSVSSSNGDPLNSPPIFQRPASASPYDQQLRDIQRQDMQARQQLRHRSSYDGFRNRSNPNYPPLSYGNPAMSQDPWMAAQYRKKQHQLQLQHQQNFFMQQYGNSGWDQQQGRYPPYVPRSGHYRNRSLGSSGGTGGRHGGYAPNGGAPYRILHSYNSPAYKNVPIWG